MREPLSETPYRIYTLDSNGKPELLVATDDVSVGEQLLYLRRHEMIGDTAPVGIMYRERDGEPGFWLVNPWSHGPPSYRTFHPVKVLDSEQTI